MNDEQIDRLLDEALKNYSRVEPPAGLTERVAASIRGVPPSGIRERFSGSVRGASRRGDARVPHRWWLWAPIPALAALVVILGLLARHPGTPRVEPRSHGTEAANTQKPEAQKPTVAVAAPRPQPAQTASALAVKRSPATRVVVPRRSIRVLTPEELATMHFRADMFPTAPQPAELVVPDLTVPEMKVPDVKVSPIEVQPIQPEKGIDPR